MQHTNQIEIREIRLPYELAVMAAAEQNFERDVRMRLANPRLWDVDRLEYVGDAIDIIAKHGRNNEPYFPDHPVIIVRTELNE